MTVRGNAPDDGDVGQADGPPPGVAARVAVDAEEGDGAGRVEAGLLAKLAAGPGLDRLVDLQEPARQGPVAGEGVVLAADQEDPEPVAREGEDRQVDGDGRAGIIVTIGGRHGLGAPRVVDAPAVGPALGDGRPLDNRTHCTGATTRCIGRNHEDLGEARLSPLVEALAGLDGPADEAGAWPAELWSTLEDGRAPRDGRCPASSAARSATGRRS